MDLMSQHSKQQDEMKVRRIAQPQFHKQRRAMSYGDQEDREGSSFQSLHVS